MDTENVQAASIHEQIESDRERAYPPGDVSLIRRFRDYARGRQRGTLTREQMKVLQGLLGNRFSDNVCRRILSVATARTEFLQWEVDNTAVSDFLEGVFIRNQVADMQSNVTFATLRDGNHAVAIRWLPDDTMEEGGRIVLYRERWWDGREGVFFAYDETGAVGYAVKEWKEHISPTTVKKRRTLYLPNMIARYIEDGRGWRPFTVFDDVESDTYGGPGIELWEKDDGSPLGLPLIHFPNGSDNDRPYGASHIDGGVLAFQDQINNIQHDISAASTMAGYQQTWSTGTALKKDSGGNDVMPQIGPGQHWHADDKDARFGVIPPGDLAALEKAYMLKIGAVSRMTSTPTHFFTGQWPSGEALIRAEIDLVEFVRDLVRSIGPAWSSVAHRSTEIYNVFHTGGPDLDEEPLIQAIFADPARRDPLTLTQIAVQQAEFISKREQLRLTGHSEQQIDKIMKEREDEAGAAAERMRVAFSAGEPAATGFPPATPADQQQGAA